MTDRFYPVGKVSEPDHWKTTYEIQNEMRAFERSPYPPGTSVHMPGAKEKFGFSSPGPIAHRLAKPELCLTEETDHPNPRAHHAVPRYQAPDDREIFENFDMPEMERSYQSPVATMSLSGGLGNTGMSASRMGMSRSLSLPGSATFGKKTVTRLHQPKTALTKLDDHQFTYFVPKSFQREGKDRMMTMNMSKMQKENKITMPQGEGTGFQSQKPHCDWYPTGSEHTVPSTNLEAFQKPPHFRMSPLVHAIGPL